MREKGRASGIKGNARNLLSSLFAATAALLVFSLPALAMDLNRQVNFNIAAQDLDAALLQFSQQTRIQIIVSSDIRGQATKGINGQREIKQALAELLEPAGLHYKIASDDSITISKTDADANTPRPLAGEGTGVRERLRLAQADPNLIPNPSPVPGQQNQSTESRDNESERPVKLEEIIVTARHRQERLRDVPMGITALTGDALSKSQRRSFEDYAALVPGLSLQQGGLQGGNRLSLRGLNAQGVGSTVAVYVDDSPVGSSTAAVNGSSFASNFDPWDMQRIEVLRGPQGMLYGASSEGGLIKFVTNPPELNELSGTVEVGAEGVSQGESGWSGKGVLNLPLGQNAAVRISAYHEILPGFVDDTLLGKRDVNEGQKDGARVSLLLAPTSDLKIRLTAFEQDLELDGTPSVDVDNSTRRPLEGAFTQRRALSERSTYRYQNYNASLDWNLGWGTAFSGTSYNVGTNHPVSDLSLVEFLGSGFPATAFLSSPGNPAGLLLTNEAGVRKFTQEFRLHSHSDGRLNWELGAFYTRETGRLYQPFSAVSLSDGSLLGPPGFVALTTLDSTYKEWAAFGNVTYAFTPQFDVQLGGRWARNEQTSLLSSQSEFFGIPLESLPGRASADKFLYSVAPRWRVRNDWLLYARVASGYQPGGVNLLPPNAPPEVPTQFEPDTTVNYELGTRMQWFDQRASLDLAVFRIDWNKVQLNQAVTVGGDDFGIVGNGGTATSKGVEWTVGLVPFNGLSLSLTGAYIDATLTSDAPVVGGESGDRLPASPEWSSSLDGEYSWNAFRGYQAYLGGTWSYNGPQVNTFSALSDAQTRVSGYAIANLRAGLQSDSWTLSLYAKNIGNKRAALLFGDSGNPAFPGSMIFNLPRTVGIAVSTRF